ncbi:MAG: hypothetical protein R3C10_25780 [Pirellulales bacterium]
MIHLEPAAESLWDNVIADCALRMRQRATAGLSEEQVETLFRLLSHVRENLTKEELVASDA